jgi:hypothetical protein
VVLVFPSSPVVPASAAIDPAALSPTTGPAAGSPARVLPSLPYRQGLHAAEVLLQQLPEEVPSAGLDLHLEAEPSYAHPGDPVTLTVTR